MGSFILTPKGSESVRFISDEGRSSRFSLPRALKSGFSVIASASTDTLLEVSIRRTPDLNTESVGLAVTCRGELVLFEEIKNNIDTTLMIDCSGWPLGVCRMTLYDKNARILSSRSLFHNNAKFSSPTI